jgi:hypothetical protein
MVTHSEAWILALPVQHTDSCPDTAPELTTRGRQTDAHSQLGRRHRALLLAAAYVASMGKDEL